MPRRNLHCLLLIAVLSLVCYQKVPGSRYSRVLSNTMDRIARRFYLPVNELDLFEGGMSGMIKRLGDEHSIYIKVAKKKAFEGDLNQPNTVEGSSLGPDGQWDFRLSGDRQIGYIRISGFAEPEQGEKDTTTNFRTALEGLHKETIRGIVLSLIHI